MSTSKYRFSKVPADFYSVRLEAEALGELETHLLDPIADIDT